MLSRLPIERCPKCGSKTLEKDDYGDIHCLCGKVIYLTSSKPYMRYPTAVVVKARELGKGGEKTYAEIAQEVAKITGKEPAKSTIHEWLNEKDDILNRERRKPEIPEDKKPSYKIKELAKAELESFKTRLRQAKLDYPKSSDEDIYFEELFDGEVNYLIGGLASLFKQWRESYPDRTLDFNRGIVYCLSILGKFLADLDAFNPDEE